jgi:chemotaxis protein MotB
MNARQTVSLSTALACLLMSCVSRSQFLKVDSARKEFKTEVADLRTLNSELTKENSELKRVIEERNAEPDDVARPVPPTFLPPRKSEKDDTVFKEISQRLSGEISEGQLQVNSTGDRTLICIPEKFFFESGIAKLKKSGESLLSKVGTVLAAWPIKEIVVVGHTDNVPASRWLAFASNWELSVGRATTVVRFFHENARLPADRLIACGRGEFQPLAPNDTPEGREKNRRIEIFIVTDSAE